MSFTDDFIEQEYKKYKAHKEELKSMPYQKYLQTPEWKQKRDMALNSADYKCQVCGSEEHLEAHHKTYTRRGREDSIDLIVLCTRCHKREHGIR